MRPVLYLFTISHYCEKARWALDYLGFDVDVRALAPGTHIKVAKRLGLKYGSVPYMQFNEEVIQGSSAIIDWAEKNTQSGRTLGSSNEQVRAIERRLDEKLGVHIRRWFYSEAVIKCPELVKPIFMHDISFLEKIKLQMRWPVIRKMMTKRMDLGPEEGLESFKIVNQEIDWLEGLIVDEDSYLIGDRLSRADITAASLLAPLVQPEQYVCSTLMQHPPRLQEDVAAMIERPFWAWVAAQYQRNRC